jgi:hypothetical protein
MPFTLVDAQLGNLTFVHLWLGKQAPNQEPNLVY